jgi:hypothetical protein
VTIEVAVLKGMLFEEGDRVTDKIRAEAQKRKLSKPGPELACLIREKFTNNEIEVMGLWHIVCMHEPIKDVFGFPELLSVYRGIVGRWRDTCYDKPGRSWDREHGFAFVVKEEKKTN